MLDRLRRSFDRERRFVADASHELRTPVAVIKTELETALRAAGEYPPEVREALVAAVEECDHLAQLAEDLLVLARASEDALPVRPEPLPARAELERARERFADRAAHQQRAIEVRAEYGTVLYADPQRLRQALGNLVDNALRHGDGDVVLAARGAAGTGAEVEVRDAGSGFPPELAERAFERFTRAADARPERGAGLGLAIVKAIAEAHGGSAELLPGPGAGRARSRLPGAPPQGPSQLSLGRSSSQPTTEVQDVREAEGGPRRARGRGGRTGRRGDRDELRLGHRPERRRLTTMLELATLAAEAGARRRAAAGLGARRARPGGLHDPDRQPVLADDAGHEVGLPGDGHGARPRCGSG